MLHDVVGAEPQPAGGDGGADARDVEAQQREAGDERVTGRVVDGLRSELPVEPGGRPEGAQLGLGGRRRAVGGAAQQVQDRIGGHKGLGTGNSRRGVCGARQDGRRGHAGGAAREETPAAQRW